MTHQYNCNSLEFDKTLLTEQFTSLPGLGTEQRLFRCLPTIPSLDLNSGDTKLW